jgi:ribosomal protein L11 methyltransferase
LNQRLDEESTDIPEKYQRLRFRVPAADEDQFVAAVWSLGTLGLESVEVAAGTCEFLAYFTNSLDLGLLDQIEGRYVLAGADLTDVDLVMDQDWQREYRARTVPFAVGQRWWVDPREPDQPVSEPPDQRQLLRIPARMAFGTGSHASTALIVELMGELRLEGRRVLDVGTGSGILAMVALASGAESVTALDIDLVAAFLALQTCRLNNLRPRLLAGGMAAIRVRPPGETFDVIVANVLPSRLRSDYAVLANCLRPAGVLLLSGLLQEQKEDVLAEMTELGFRPRSHLGRDEWVALHLERAFP